MEKQKQKCAPLNCTTVTHLMLPKSSYSTQTSCNLQITNYASNRSNLSRKISVARRNEATVTADPQEIVGFKQNTMCFEGRMTGILVGQRMGGLECDGKRQCSEV